jgi:hypothetical protein
LLLKLQGETWVTRYCFRSVYWTASDVCPAFVHIILRNFRGTPLEPRQAYGRDVRDGQGNEARLMRRQFGSVAILGILAGTALVATPAVPDEASEKLSAPIAVQRTTLSTIGFREEAAMVLVGGALIGLAAAVRRAA